MSNNNELQPRKALEEMTPYSPGKPIWEVQQELGLDEVIKLASNENPLGPSPKAIAAITDSLSELHRYPDRDAIRLKLAIAEIYGIDANQLIITNGGDELITLVSEAFLNADDEIIVPEPTFSEYKFGALLMGATVSNVLLNQDFTYNVEAILSAITDRTKLLYLCSPNNPTGTILTKSQLRLILDSLPKRVLVVMDAAYSHFADSAEYSGGVEFIKAGYPIVLLQTFSKIFGLAGIRVGFGIAPSSIIQSIVQVKEPFNVNALAQTAAIAAIGDIDHVNQTRDLIAKEREVIYTSLEQLNISFTRSMSNFILVELGDNAHTIYKKLMEKGVIVRYGLIWRLPQHIRVTVGLPEENKRFIQALQEILLTL